MPQKIDAKGFKKVSLLSSSLDGKKKFSLLRRRVSATGSKNYGGDQMPGIIPAENLGCAPMRALTFDYLGLIKYKGGEVMDNEEVIIALADVFLHLVGDLSSNTSDYSEDVSLTLENAMKEGISVIDFYVRRGQFLELHDCACLAFSRTLHFNTSLLGYILNYFKKAPPPYQRILVKEHMQVCLLSEPFEMVSLAVSQKRPVLLYGPSGSGKSALIRKLADESGNHGDTDTGEFPTISTPECMSCGH